MGVGEAGHGDQMGWWWFAAAAGVVDFCQIGGLVTGGTVNGGDDEFGIDAAKRAYLLPRGRYPWRKH